MSAAFRMARSARLAATGCFRTNSRLPPQAAEVLGPGAVDRAADHDMTNLFGPEFLRSGGKPR